MLTRKILLSILLLQGISGVAMCQVHKLNFPAQATELQKQNVTLLHQSTTTILNIFENSIYKGLQPDRYHVAKIRGLADRQPIDSAKYTLIADGLITYCRDLQQSQEIASFISYDEVSGKYVEADIAVLLNKLSNVRSEAGLMEVLKSLEPADSKYASLLSELRTQIDSNHSKQIKALRLTIAYYRWIHHFNFRKCIVVNIPSATLECYEHNKETLDMKVVVGKPATRTPRFAAYCNQVILYPYWHVPRSIAVNEILPKCKRNAGTVNAMNLQVLDSKGRLVNPSNINWGAYSRSNFPYTFRQATGCDNALGVIKFNITSPFSVYMHDTNYKNAFNSGRRYLSHGCIRVEKPLALANFLLTEQINESFVTSCIKGQKPVIKPLAPVPVFVVYMPVTLDSSGTIIYNNDVYNLL